MMHLSSQDGSGQSNHPASSLYISAMSPATRTSSSSRSAGAGSPPAAATSMRQASRSFMARQYKGAYKGVSGKISTVLDKEIGYSDNFYIVV